MLKELFSQITPEQRLELERRGIRAVDRTRFSKGQRLPTEVQVAVLADVFNVEWASLQREITVLRAPADRRREIAKAIGASVRNF